MHSTSARARKLPRSGPRPRPSLGRLAPSPGLASKLAAMGAPKLPPPRYVSPFASEGSPAGEPPASSSPPAPSAPASPPSAPPLPEPAEAFWSALVALIGVAVTFCRVEAGKPHGGASGVGMVLVLLEQLQRAIVAFSEGDDLPRLVGAEDSDGEAEEHDQGERAPLPSAETPETFWPGFQGMMLSVIAFVRNRTATDLLKGEGEVTAGLLEQLLEQLLAWNGGHANPPTVEAHPISDDDQGENDEEAEDFAAVYPGQRDADPDRSVVARRGTLADALLAAFEDLHQVRWQTLTIQGLAEGAGKLCFDASKTKADVHSHLRMVSGETLLTLERCWYVEGRLAELASALVGADTGESQVVLIQKLGKLFDASEDEAWSEVRTRAASR
jgi:hypothetical protein